MPQATVNTSNPSSTPSKKSDAAPKGAASGDQSLSDPALIKEANRFALQLVQNKDLLMAWFDMLAKALKDKQYEVQIMDNFIAQKSLNKVDDFNTTYGYVIQAQQKLAAYQMYYWSGLYKTTKKAKGDTGAGSEGDVISIVGSGAQSTATFVSVAKAELIGYQFSNLVLSWDTQGGLNATSGNLIFGLRNISGVATKTFAGTINEQGSDFVYAGVMVDPSKNPNAVNKAPPQTSASLQKLQFANQIINMVSQTLFMAVNIGMLYKTGKEIQELKAKIAKGDASEADKAALKQKSDAQEVNEKAADQASEEADSISDPVESMSEQDFSLGSEDASPASEASSLPDIEPPSNMEDLELSESEADVAQEAIESEIEESGEEVNSMDADDAGSGEESSAMEDGEDVLTSDAESFMGDMI